jgi:uncharacterized protein
MSIQRDVAKRLLRLSKSFRAVAVIGPRQSGKTTLCKMVFPGKPYTSLENPSVLQFAQSDPEGFLAQYPKGAIIDEAQRMPELFSYLQQILDETKKTGLFILTGSNNFLMQQNITQSLAGRIGYITLLPFSINELAHNGLIKKNWRLHASRGFYPEVNTKRIQPGEWYTAYAKTYIERDVRQIKNIGNLALFTKFLSLCAGRAAQVVNVNAIANDCGIDNKTVNSWLGILESSFIIYFLKPFYKNYNKQVTKSSKLYFYDTGLLCHLLHISGADELQNNMHKGAVFENLIVAEKVKQVENFGLARQLFFWRDKTGNEIDLLADDHKNIIIAEIKAAETITPAFWKTLLFFEKLHGSPLKKEVYYGGDESQNRSGSLTIKGWSSIPG